MRPSLELRDLQNAAIEGGQDRETNKTRSSEHGADCHKATDRVEAEQTVAGYADVFRELCRPGRPTWPSKGAPNAWFRADRAL